MKIEIPVGETPGIKYKTPGGNQGQGSVARTNATNAAIYANATNAMSYANATANYVADETQRRIVSDIKDTINEDQYKIQMQNRDIQIQGQLEAYQRNASNVANQLDLNRKAAIRAQDQAEGVFKDRLKSEEFNLSNTNLQYMQGIARDRFEASGAARAIEAATEDNILNQQRSALEAARTIRQLEFNKYQSNAAANESFARSMDQRNNLLRKYGEAATDSQYQVDELGRGRDRSLAEQLFVRQQQDSSLNRADSLRTFEQQQLQQQNDQFNSAKNAEKDQLDRQLKYFTSQKSYENEALDRELNRFDSSKEYEKQSLDRSYERFKAAKEYEQAQALIAYEDKRSQAMFQQEARLFQRATEIGANRATGQRGRSAARGMRAISAMAGIDIARLNDQIDRAYDVYNTSIRRSNAEITEQGIETTARKSRADATKAETRTETTARKSRNTGLVAEQTEENTARDLRIEVEKTEAEDSRLSRSNRADSIYSETEADVTARKARSLGIDAETRKTTTAKQDRVQQRLDETRAASVDAFNQSIDADMREHERAQNSNRRQNDLISETKAMKRLSDSQSLIKKNRDQSTAKDRLDLISKTMGLKAEAFKMDRRAIGESILSAAAAWDSAQDDIYLKKYEADVKTYANRMFEPKFADAPKAPFKTPSFESIPPAKPIEVPRGAVAPRPEAPKQSGLSKVLQIGALAVGALAAPLTAGGSLGWAAAATGLSAGFSVGSAFT